jgi:hypothetical protein
VSDVLVIAFIALAGLLMWGLIEGCALLLRR